MIIDALRVLPELGVFLAVAGGFWFGNIKLGNFSLGTVTSALILGLVLGNFWKEPSPDLRSSFFLLFLFANGYSVGPQFVRALRSSGMKPMVLSVVVSVSGLASAIFVARALNLDVGLGAGLFSGSMTASAAIGTATDAIKGLPLPAESAGMLISHVVVADALCYIFGAIGVIWFAGTIAPRLLQIDLRKEAKALERELGMEEHQAGVFSAKQRFTARTFRLDPDSDVIGRRVAEVESLEPGGVVFLARLRRCGAIVETSPDTVLQAGDTVVLYGHIGAVLAFGRQHAEETVDEELLDFPAEILRVVITNPKLCNRPGIELRRLPETRLVVVRSVKRGDQQLPLGDYLTLQQGDIVELLGPVAAVERIAKSAGYILRPNTATPLSMLGFGIVLGGVVGAPFLMLGTFKLTLGVTVGVLMLGVVAGWLTSVRPMLPVIPEPAIELMKSLGLAVFVAGAGMMAGPVFLDAVRKLGISILLGGVVVTLVPQCLALFVGHYVLRMNPILLLGALAGAQTYTGALAAVQEKSGSSVAVLGYTVPYATSNVLLTAFGAIVVMLLA
ncbi:MAG TPA: TrkA C-terminal domain-containing protein [Hyphomicrobiales bacterium]|jgi:putative transport protein